ncbi:winged helix-turn-helix domain-containing protein [Micromonospora sp. NPDC050417]|uniref:winged helix-turn-helix domain-containing protein n=1 Tax=Micromonospora sp. NPDC050417 TaxID=3364280 RepID=UPI0037BD6906
MEREQPGVTPDPRVVKLDSRQIRTLAHPLRSRLLGALRIGGPATATALAQALDTNTGATSYHLRQLAEVGLVAEDPERGTGRQRWWRAVHEVSQWQSTDFDGDPDASAASDWIQREQLRLFSEQAERWIGAQHDYPAAWRGAAAFNDAVVTLPPDRLRQLTEEIWQVVKRYRRESVPADPGAEQVLIYLTAFPWMGES